MTSAGAKAFFSRRAARAARRLRRARRTARPPAGRLHALASAVAGAVPRDARILLPGYILSSQGDRVAMAHAVEGRFPFLDHRVIEFAARIPPRLKLQGLAEKHILREATQRPAAGRHRQAAQAALPRAGQPRRSCGSGAPAYVAGALSPARIADGRAASIPRPSHKLVRKCAAGRFVGFRDNARLRRHPVDPALARDVRSAGTGTAAASRCRLHEPPTKGSHPCRQSRTDDQARSASSSRTTSCSARTASAIGDDESLLDAGLIDSTGILELVAFLEAAVRHRRRRRGDRAGKSRFDRAASTRYVAAPPGGAAIAA